MYNLIISVFLCSLSLAFGSPSFNRLSNSEFVDNTCINNMCNWTANYPEQKILKAVSKNSSYASMFGNVLLQQQKISTRVLFESRNMCPSSTITYTPRTAANVEGIPRTIVNIDGYQQLVTIQVCDKNAQCFANSILRDDEQHLECKTQHVIVRLVVFKDNESLDVEHFSVPSGCYCSFKDDNKERLPRCNT